MFVTRPLLLKNYANYTDRDYNRLYRPHIDACIAARDTMELVLEFVNDNQFFTAFWYTQYITFNALSIAHLYLLQVKGDRIQPFQARAESRRDIAATSYESRLQELAETIFQNLAKVTIQNSPRMRYAAILEGLRTEVIGIMQAPYPEQLPEDVPDEMNWSRFLGSFGPVVHDHYVDNPPIDSHQVAEPQAIIIPHTFATYEQTLPLNDSGDIAEYDPYAAQPQEAQSLLSAYDDLGLDFWSQMDSLPICKFGFVVWTSFIADICFTKAYTNIQNT